MSLWWLPLAIITHVTQAANGIIDRIIIHREISSPLLISFWVALFSFATLLLPLLAWLPWPAAAIFRFALPPVPLLILILTAGVLLQAGLFLLFRAVRDEEATRVFSILGAATPIFTLGLAWLLALEHLSFLDLAAFAVLIIGAVTLAGNPRGARRRALLTTLAAAVIFATQSVLAKIIFNQHHFVSAFVLMALGGGLYAITILVLSPRLRRQVRQIVGRSAAGWQGRAQRGQIVWVAVNSMIGGVSLVTAYLALKLGPPSLVTSLRGVQYAAIFIFALALARRHPRLLDEELSGQSLRQKVTGIGLVIVGIAMIALEF